MIIYFTIGFVLSLVFFAISFGTGSWNKGTRHGRSDTSSIALIMVIFVCVWPLILLALPEMIKCEIEKKRINQ